MKFCKDCKHYVPETGLIAEVDRTKMFSRCSYPFDINLVSGEVRQRFCSTARNHEHYCGEKAKKFIPLHPEPLDNPDHPEHNSSIKSKTFLAQVLNFFRRNT